MAKKMCPVSRRMCTDCNLYIGRHYFTCLSGDEVSKRVTEDRKNNKRQYVAARDDGMFGLSDFNEAPKTGSWYHNIEDIYILGQG
ncbi:MAG: hypothetical protein FWG92_03495 [Leptospirales bacterium]|nr:hypothetical protein [Leptospirales bacterium]